MNIINDYLIKNINSFKNAMEANKKKIADMQIEAEHLKASNEYINKLLIEIEKLQKGEDTNGQSTETT